MAKYIKIYPQNPNEKEIDKVVTILKEGGLVIYPTDTVYGLGCDITQSKALEKLAQIKGIKLEKAHFSFICSSMSMLSSYVKPLENTVFKTLKTHLPGGFTFVLQGGGNLPKIFKSRKTVGVRIPDNAIAQQIVEKLGSPIVSTSIYDDDELIEYTTDPELIFEKWQNRIDALVDGGYGDNIASTVVDLTQKPAVVLRQGRAEYNT